MAATSNIQWTDATWNIARGCTKVDEDCKFCYMYRESLNGTRYEPKTVTKTKTVFNLPLKLKEPSKIFTSSLTDFFHEDCDAFRREAWEIIRQCPQHTFQILTKRPERIIDHLPSDWGEGWQNVWLGTSVGSNESAYRIKHILSIKAVIRFLSLEPLHSMIDNSWLMPLHYCNECGSFDGWMDGHGEEYIGHVCENCDSYMGLTDLLDWVIVGGESGNENGIYKYRPCNLNWIEEIVGVCDVMGIPVFVKQLGTHLAKQLKLSDRHGGNIDEWPEHLRVREMPNLCG